MAFFFHPRVTPLGRSVAFFDSVGLGLFCVAASAKALAFGLGALPSVLLGVVRGIDVGILRDRLSGETPAVLQRNSQLYAIPAIVSCTIVVTALHLRAPEALTQLLAAVFITGLRLLAIWRKWRGPVPAAPHS